MELHIMITKGAKEPKLKIFAERFGELRGDKTQAEFADFIGISRPTIGFYENGERLPDALVLKTIAEKCNVSSDWLLGLSDVKTSNYNIKEVNSLTGLSEKNIRLLTVLNEHKAVQKKYFDSPSKRHYGSLPYIEIINMILELMNKKPDLIRGVQLCAYYFNDPNRATTLDYYSASGDLEYELNQKYSGAMKFIEDNNAIILAGKQVADYYLSSLKNEAEVFFSTLMKLCSSNEEERNLEKKILKTRINGSLRGDCQSSIFYMKQRLKEEETTRLYFEICSELKNVSSEEHSGMNISKTYYGFKHQYKQWKAAVKAGTKTEEEFIAWLKEVKEKKVL